MRQFLSAGVILTTFLGGMAEAATVTGACARALQESISQTRTAADGSLLDQSFQGSGITLFREPSKKILLSVLSGKNLTQIESEMAVKTISVTNEPAPTKGVKIESLNFPPSESVTSLKVFTDKKDRIVGIQEWPRAASGENGVEMKFKWGSDGECTPASLGTLSKTDKSLVPYASLEVCADPILLHYRKKLDEMKNKDTKIEEINAREDKVMRGEIQKLTRLENDLNFKYDKDKDHEKISQLRKSLTPLKEKLVKDAMTYNNERLKLIPDPNWIDQGLPEAKSTTSQYLKDRFEYYSYIFNSDRRDSLRTSLIDIKDYKNPQDDEIGFLDRHPAGRSDLQNSLRGTFKVMEHARKFCSDLGFDEVLEIDKLMAKGFASTSRKPASAAPALVPHSEQSPHAEQSPQAQQDAQAVDIAD